MHDLINQQRLTPEIKKGIDDLSLVQMAELWKQGLDGCQLFTGEIGEYFVKRVKLLQQHHNEIYFNTANLR